MPGNPLTDILGHGTHVAGIVLQAQGDNPMIDLVSLRVFNDDGNGFSSYVGRAIDFARRNGIEILNLSGGWDMYNPGIRGQYNEFLRAVIDNFPGLLIVIAHNQDRDITYDVGSINVVRPASYLAYNLITVGATIFDEELQEVRRAQRGDGWRGSNYSHERVELFAPGTRIRSMLPRAMGYYGYNSGTSFAAPWVTGVAALLRSVTPEPDEPFSGILEIRDIILNNVDSRSGLLKSFSSTGGHLNAAWALCSISSLDCGVDGCPTCCDDAPRTITITGIQGVTVPHARAAPAGTITATDQFTGTVTWSPRPVNGAFSAGTQYTARIELTPMPGFTLQGLAANSFSVAGATSVTHAANSGMVTAVFPRTCINPVNMRNIIITPPRHGSIPASEIYETFQFAGSVSWHPTEINFRKKATQGSTSGNPEDSQA